MSCMSCHVCTVHVCTGMLLTITTHTGTLERQCEGECSSTSSPMHRVDFFFCFRLMMVLVVSCDDV